MWRWVEGWSADAAPTLDPARHWAHPGIQVVGDVVWTSHPNGHTLLGYSPDGELLHEQETGLLELHGIQLPWLVDTGSKRFVRGPEFETERRRGSVGDLPGPYPDDRKYSPTAVAVDPNGAIWVADGYGQSVVHRYTPDGELDLTLDGFDTPHSLTIDGDLLLVCDRAHGVIKEYGLDGTLRRELGRGTVVTPTDLVLVDGLIVLTDFTAARLTVLTREGALVEHLFAGDRSPDEEAWPNARDAAGHLVRPPLRSGAFNSPHTLAADAAGDLYVTEWLIGGRVTKLTRYRGESWISA
jgi:hypothetical protein